MSSTKVNNSYQQSTTPFVPIPKHIGYCWCHLKVKMCISNFCGLSNEAVSFVVKIVCPAFELRSSCFMYDREREKIGFWKTNCSDISGVSHISGVPPQASSSSDGLSSTAETSPSVAQASSPSDGLSPMDFILFQQCNSGLHNGQFMLA